MQPVHLTMTDRAVRLLERTKQQGAVVEFGVFQGHGLLQIAHLMRERGMQPRLYGFDTFAGMPPTEVVGGDLVDEEWDVGAFSDTSAETVRQRFVEADFAVTLVEGVFDPSVPLSDRGIEQVAMVHIDADIYEGYRDALTLLTPHLQAGMILLLDESEPPGNADYFFGVQRHGQRAFHEWWLEHDVPLLHVRSEWTIAMYVVVDKPYLEEHGTFITMDLMSDTVEEALVPEIRHAIANCGSPPNMRPRLARRMAELYQKLQGMAAAE